MPAYRPYPIEIIYDMQELGRKIHKMEDDHPYRKAYQWIEGNPPGPCVYGVIITTPVAHHAPISLNPPETFSWEAYEKALEEKKFRDEYNRRTGKVWEEPERKEAPSHRSLPHESGQDEGVVDFDAALQILGLRPGYSESDLKSAYRKAMKECHPDKVASMSPELRALAEKKSKRINEANSLLTEELGSFQRV